jgi:hypothetical protein
LTYQQGFKVTAAAGKHPIVSTVVYQDAHRTLSGNFILYSLDSGLLIRNIRCGPCFNPEDFTDVPDLPW